jgi:hypothetical protein
VGDAAARVRAVHRHLRRGSGRPRATLLAAFVPTALTLAYEWTTGDMPSNWIRAAAGLPIGAAVAAIVAVPSSRPARSASKVN